MASSRRLWMKLNANGRVVRVHVVRKIEHPDGSHTGAAVMSDGNIEVEQIGDVDAMKMALYHEIKHVALWGFSSSQKAHALGDDWEDVEPDREERVVALSEPMEYSILAGNGLLKIKNPPKL